MIQWMWDSHDGIIRSECALQGSIGDPLRIQTQPASMAFRLTDIVAGAGTDAPFAFGSEGDLRRKSRVFRTQSPAPCPTPFWMFQILLTSDPKHPKVVPQAPQASWGFLFITAIISCNAFASSSSRTDAAGAADGTVSTGATGGADAVAPFAFKKHGNSHWWFGALWKRLDFVN